MTKLPEDPERCPCGRMFENMGCHCEQMKVDYRGLKQDKLLSMANNTALPLEAREAARAELQRRK